MPLRTPLARIPLPALLLLGLAAPAAGGCSGGSQQVKKDGTAPCTSCVSLQVRSFDGPRVGPIEPGAELVSGSGFSLTVSTDLPLYLQVGRRSARGLTPLLPAPGQPAARATPNVPTILPADGGKIQLDDQTGEEAIYVLASRQPLSAEQSEQGMKREAASLARTPARADGTRGVDETNSRNRDFDKATMTLWGKLEPDGVVLLVFPFRHS